MARNRIIDVAYRLKDLFTGQVGKITAGYRKIGDEAETASRRTDNAFRKTDKVLTGITSMAGRLAGLLGVSVGVGAAGREFSKLVDEADRLGKVSQKLGFSVEELQRLGFAAERNGVQFDTMAVAVQRMTRRLAEVANTGKGEAAPALDALGLSAEKLNSLNLEDRMALLADAFANISDQGERVRIAFKLFDTEGVDMVRVLQEGSAAFRKLTAAAGKFGRIIDKETTRQAAEFNDTLKQLGLTWDRLVLDLGGPVLNELNDFTKNIGISSDETANLSTELLKAEIRLDSLNRQKKALGIAPGVDKRIEQTRKEITRLRQELDKLTKADKASQEQQESSRETIRQTQLQQKELTKAIEQQVAAYEVGAKRAKAVRDKETAELRAARAEQASIEREFASLVEEIAGETQDANIIDTNYLKFQAQQALNQGNLDDAIEKARAAGEMLRDLRQAGEGGFELKFLAKELERIANAATGNRVNNELFDLQQAKNSVNAIKKELEALNGTTITVTAELNPVVRGNSPVDDALRDAISQRGRK